ncbi:cilia- and flagella-associated protein 20-like [Tautogolabrus adspersus]
MAVGLVSPTERMLTGPQAEVNWMCQKSRWLHSQDRKIVGQTVNGHIERITDEDIRSLVLEVAGLNVSTTYITCPADPQKTLGIKLPFLALIVKNLKKDFTFEVQVVLLKQTPSMCCHPYIPPSSFNFQVLDHQNIQRRFRVSTNQRSTKVDPLSCTMPMTLDDGWNRMQFNLSDFTRRAFGTNFIETLRVQISANCQLRRVYFSDRLYSEDELPREYRLYLPVQNKKTKQ